MHIYIYIYISRYPICIWIAVYIVGLCTASACTCGAYVLWCIRTVDNYNPAYETRGALVDIYDGPAADPDSRSMIMTQIHAMHM